MDIIFIGSVVGLLFITAIKCLNLGQGGKMYGGAGALAGGAIAGLLWFFAFTIFTASIVGTTTSTITGGSSGTITIVEQGNQYVGLQPLMTLAGILLLACLFLTVVETFAFLGNTAIQMAGGPRAEKYGK